MKAIVIREPGKGVAAWKLVDRPEPRPGPGQVLVRVRAASLNYRDLMAARNLYGAPQPDVIALSDGAGEIVALGPGVRRWKVGDRVAAAYYPTWHAGPIRPEHDLSVLGAHANDGLLAEYAVLPESGVAKLPSYLSYEAASTLPCAALTAWNALFETPVRVKPGGTVLVQGTGGVSIFAAQLARAEGLRVIATSSSADKRRRLQTELGVSDIIDYRATPAWHERVLELTGGEGVDQVIDVGGTGTLAESFQATRYGGTVSVIGLLTGVGAATDPLPVLFRALRLEGVRVGSTAMFEAMNRALEVLRIAPVIDEVFPIERARDALVKLEAGKHFGKIVVRID
jgi:NADPH:quinone reductase-like Zn-dependent oxidoreductase